MSVRMPAEHQIFPGEFREQPLFERQNVVSEDGHNLLIPVYGRSSHTLARHYGYPNVETMARDLPSGTKVLDVGAGSSTLGLEVCRLNPNISWVSADVCYAEEDVRAQIAEHDGLPPNLKFIPADVRELPKWFGIGGFHDVLSYYLIQHLEIADHQVALTGVENILRMGAQGGRIKLGPAKGLKLGLGVGGSVAVETPKNEKALRSLAPELLEKIRLKGLAARMQKTQDNISVR